MCVSWHDYHINKLSVKIVERNNFTEAILAYQENIFFSEKRDQCLHISLVSQRIRSSLRPDENNTDNDESLDMYFGTIY